MVYIHAIGTVNALAGSTSELSEALRNRVHPQFEIFPERLAAGTATRVAAVKTQLPEIPKNFPQHSTRNNQLLLAALEQIRPAVAVAIARFGAARVGIILGTSNTGIREGELAVAHREKYAAFPAHYFYEHQELGSPARFLADVLNTRGPVYTISTACSSTARALISAKRLLEANVVDAVIAGGADALCRMTLNGFHSLQALSPATCTPFAKNRDGITIGEGSALLLLTREPAPLALCGVGESSDAHHISAPDPTGAGAEIAMRAALADAGIGDENDIGYINLHGTGTPLNDSMEARAVYQLFGDKVPCSSTKHLTGHTLGTCGAIEAAIACAILSGVTIPLPAQQIDDDTLDPALPPIALIRAGADIFLKRKMILSNSFAFGGNNAALIFTEIA